jgi:hypothetical protein
MVWSSNSGTSIVLPSDRVDGDGRNYIVIGEDTPDEIAADFTAALVFRSGKYDGSAAATTDIPGGGPQAGFVFYAFGISTKGNLEIVAYFFSVGSQQSDVYTYYRTTVFSVAAPKTLAAQPGEPNGPVLSLGTSPAYDSYEDNPAKVQISGVAQSDYPPEFIGQYLTAPMQEYDSFTFTETIYRDADGWVHLNAVIKNGSPSVTLAGSATLGVLPAIYRPGRRTPLNVFHSAGAATRLDIGTDGKMFDPLHTMAPGDYLVINASWPSSDATANM